MIEIEILYANGKRPRVAVAASEMLGFSRKGVLAVLLSAPKDGVPTRVAYQEGRDNYIVGLHKVQSRIYLGAWDDNEGGTFHLTNPFVTDQYPQPTMPPYLLPCSVGGWEFWSFAGEQVGGDVWAATDAVRRSMR